MRHLEAAAGLSTNSLGFRVQARCGVQGSGLRGDDFLQTFQGSRLVFVGL